MQYEIGGVTNDSDEDVDVTKMDLGKSGKGPMNRFDFDNEDDYGEYMAKREALPKAAFQYGQKNRGEFIPLNHFSGFHYKNKKNGQCLAGQCFAHDCSEFSILL